MKSTLVVIFCTVFAIVLARPSDKDEKLPPPGIKVSEYTAELDGSYKFHYEGEDMSERTEEGIVMNPGTDKAYVAVKGQYKYYDPNNKLVVINYTSDDHGFYSEGDGIPAIISKAAKANGMLPPNTDY